MKKKKLDPRQASIAILLGVIMLMVFMSLPLFQSAQKLSPIAELGGPFELVNQNGETVTEKNFFGKPTLYFFGFTHCPDVCPTTLNEMSRRLQELGEHGDKINIVFVSVDPARDTPPVLKDYLESFDPRLIGLTGTQAQVDKIVKAFHVHAQKTPLQKNAYSVDHTASTFATNRKGEVVMIIGYGEAPEMMREKINRLLNS